MKPDSEKPLLAAIDNNSSVKKVEPGYSFLHTLSGTLSEPVIITDKQLKIENCNKPASQLFGFSDTEALGKKFPDMVLEDDCTNSFEKILREIADKGKWEGKIVSNKKNILTALS